MTNYIEISGKNDKGPWTVKRIEPETCWETEAYRFGELTNDIIELIKGRNVVYEINYKGSHGGIFEESEKNVIYYIVNTHNKLIDLI